MGGRIRYTEEFKLGAVERITNRGHSITSVAGRLGVSTKSFYDWVIDACNTAKPSFKTSSKK